MLTIDGSMGEGGGQILRSALALSLLTDTPFRITGIRAGRARPGLMRQHLVALQAATEVGSAETSDADIGSTEVTFRPRNIRGGDYSFALGGAGSTTLVFQTIALPLLLGTDVPSRLTFEGGTHNPMAPPFEFLKLAFLPLLARMGGMVESAITHYGFYPTGGGAWSAELTPTKALTRLDLLERGEILRRHASALVSQIDPKVGLREVDALASMLGWDPEHCRPKMIEEPRGPGNALQAFIESEHVTEVVTGFGERGVRAEAVAKGVAEETARYLKAAVPVGEHLADQLLMPMALGKGGTFRTVTLSQHSRTQIEILKMFLPVTIAAHDEGHDLVRIEVETRN